ncbi:guanylate kinase [Cytobacillus sp. FJAT-54145]|uniref:Guanylate kinase n=1 Tax=Cytobacillus spartinae TaxID=3299023 RepID=A0ABW6KC85_9BACI
MGKVVVLTGPSTSGKSSILTRLGLKSIVTSTTRTMRPGEQQGIDYHFHTLEEFDDLVEQGEMPERTVYAGVKYGILKRVLDVVKEDKEDYAVILDVVGLEFLRDYLGKDRVLGLFVGVSPATIEKRLEERGTAREERQRRIKQAAEKELSLSYRAHCDVEVWNEHRSLEETTDDIRGLIRNHGFVLPE